MVVRVVLVLLAAGLVTAPALGARALDSVRSRNVSCDEIIELTRFPHWGNAQPQYWNRLVLDAISVPPAFLQQVNPSGEPPWRYFSKWGMVVRSDGRSVTVTVPARWRDRVAISWGNAGHGVFQTIRFAGCRFKQERRERVRRRLLPPLALSVRAADVSRRRPHRDGPLRHRPPLLVDRRGFAQRPVSALVPLGAWGSLGDER